MAFFEDTTVTELVQRNIERVDDLEEKQQRKLLRVFRKVRQELSDRLLAVPEGTFTEQQINVTLVQIQAAIEAIKRDLTTGIVDASEILAERGVKDLIGEVNRFSKKFEGSVQPLNLDAILIAIDAQNFLVNKYEASIEAYASALRSDITQRIMVGFTGRETNQQTISRLRSDVGQFFLGEEWKLNRIVRTEMHNIYNFAKMKGMGRIQEDTLPDLKKTLMHPIDSRTGEDSKQLAKKNPIVAIDEPFRFTFNGRERVFQFPPDRPNDRAILVPYRKAWDKREATFRPGA